MAEIIAKQDEIILAQKEWMALRNIPCEIRDVSWVRDIQNKKIEIGRLERKLEILKSHLINTTNGKN